jgi:predicted enzyme related to lactoylglutathione lyase
MVSLGAGSPALLFAEHLEGERPVLVYRVDDLDAATTALREQGAEVGDEFGIPHGPVRAITTPSGNRLAIYQLTRPERAEQIKGRRDF